MELLAYFRAVLRRWWLVAICVVLGAGIGWGSTLLDSGEAKPGRTYFQATTTLTVDSLNPEPGGLQPSVRNVEQIALLTTTGDVPDRVASSLETDETGVQLAEKVMTTTDPVTSTLDITVVDAKPARAAQLADEFATALTASLRQRDQDNYDEKTAEDQEQIAELQSKADALLARLRTNPPDADTVQRQYDATRNAYYNRFAQAQSLTAAGPANTSISVLVAARAFPISASAYNHQLSLGAAGLNHTSTSADESSAITGATSSTLSSPMSRTAVGALLGILIGIALALLVDHLDRHLRTRDEAEEAFGLPVLAEVPKLSHSESADDQLVAFTAPMSRAAEAFRAVRTSVTFQQHVGAPTPEAIASNGQNGDGHAHLPAAEVGDTLVVMVTSAAPREGKSTTTANLAVAFAETDAAVLIVNCDFRRPTIHRRFGLSDEPRRVQDTSVPGVKIVTNVLSDPRATPSQVVAAQRQVIAAARGRFDVILLDTAPLLTANDAIDVIASVDLVLLVAQSGMSTRPNAQRVVNLLARVDAQLAGVVLVATPDVSNDYYYYYQQSVQEGRRPRTTSGAGAADIFSPAAVDDPITR